MSGKVVFVKKGDWGVEEGKIWEKVYMDEEGMVDDGWGEGSVIRTDVELRGFR